MDEQWQEGMFITLSGGPETVIIETIYQQIASTTISAINYDSGSTGACTIVLAKPTAGLQRNSLIQLNGTENVRVLSVTLGPDGIPSIRCSTTGTFSAGQAIDGFRSFRAYFTVNHTTAETISASYVQLAIAAGGISSLSKVSTLDLSSTDTGATRPIQENDLIHVSVLVSDFSAVTELQIQLDIDATSNDFTQNYYFKSIRQPDLLAAVKQTASSLTAQQQEIQREQIDDFRRQALLAEQAQIQAEFGNGGIYGFQADQLRQQRLNDIQAELGSGLLIQSGQGALSSSGVTGNSQWTELKIPIKEFQRVGSDTSRGWKDVKAFRLSINATSAVNVGLDSLWIGGTFGPTFSDRASRGYNYVYRARNTVTGSKSNPSPPLRSEILPERDSVSLTIPAGYPDTQADVFDIFRIGGTISTYNYVGSINTGGSLTFTDQLPDDWVVRQEQLLEDRFKPWIRFSQPIRGTCNVVGTTVTITSITAGTMSLAITRGTIVVIAGTAYSIYTNPSSLTRFELNENAGSQTGVSFEIPEPVLDGQPLAFVFGPYGGGVSAEFLFALGDPENPGRLYWSNRSDPESTRDINNLEICDPGERLQSGCILDGIIYVWSDRRSWRILPSFNGGQSGGGSDFYAQPTAMGRGLSGRWALAWGDQLYFESYDGIYASRGDALTSLTDESIAPLFRRDGGGINETFSSGSLQPISFDPADEKYRSLTYSKDGLYYTYRSTSGNFFVLYYSFLTQGWSLDSFTTSVIFRIVREIATGFDKVLAGTQNGAVYELNPLQFSDDGNFINCLFRDREEDWGDSRGQKPIGDVMIDANPAGQTIFASLLYDNGTTSTNLTNLTGTSRERFIRDINNGTGLLARSVSIDLSWIGSSSVPKLYEWQPTALVKSPASIKRATDWDDGGSLRLKWLQGIRLKADTYGSAKTVEIQGDEGAVITTLNLVHNGEVVKDYSWTPFLTHEMRVIGTDGNPGRILDYQWVWEPEPSPALIWEMQYSSFDLPGYLHIRDLFIAHRSAMDITLSLYIDGTLSNIYTIPSSSGSRTKSYLPVLANKGKLFKLSFTSSSPFALYLKDIEVRVKAWGQDSSPYNILRPFGDTTRDFGGATI